MRKITLTRFQKHCEDYPDELSIASDNNIYCKVCNVKVTSERKCTVVNHRASKEHLAGLSKFAENQKPKRQSFISWKIG